ncbi:MAG: nitroreductase family protein [Dehalococcoidia bacterium]|nr:nitroreductase family protein [Dehalococcoidia bacterium]
MDLDIVDSLLTTTRSVRKRLDLDRPVEPEVIERCIEIAMQAPTASNLQGWHFVVVQDPAKRAAIADIYRRAFAEYRAMQERRSPLWGPEDLRAVQRMRIGPSSGYLAENMHRVPVLILPCVESEMAEVPHLSEVREHASLYNATIYGSILPAAWSLMLALRARGLGAAWTTLHLMYEAEAAQVLGIPEQVVQAALLPVAYYTGSGFRSAKRLPAGELTHWDGWEGTR